MLRKGENLLYFLAILVATAIVLIALIYPTVTIAQSSFIDNLPADYTVFPGQLTMGKSCSCSTGGISGAPPPPPPCNTNPCFGSSSTRYGWITTDVADINSTYCIEKIQADKGVPPCFQLDGDDALLISGNMSAVKELTYYSFTAYQSFTYDSRFSDNYAPTGASVNLGLNNTNLKMGGDGKYILILTASKNTLNVIKKAIRDSGAPEAIINTYLIPATMTNVGTSAYPDQLSFLVRLTSQTPEERQQVDAFVEQNSTTTKVAFIKGPGRNGDVTYDSLPKWEDELRANNVEYITGLNQKLRQLEQAVISRYVKEGYKFYASLTENMSHGDARYCSTNPTYCAYDSPDALYLTFPCSFSPSSIAELGCNIQIGKDSDSIFVLLGVDHTLVADKSLGSYFSYEAKPVAESQDGTFSFVGLHTQGSANPYLPAGEADNLYAVKIARSCGNEPYCASVPYLGETSENVGFNILGRVYLDKITGTAPNPGNLIPARLLWLTKNNS